VLLDGKVIHVRDVLADREFTGRGYYVHGNYRTSLGVPLSTKEETIGVFVIARSEVREFTDKQIKLVTTFADQAVIAIENARLLNELRQRTSDLTESLEQQTATSEVLQVISSSSGDLKPVFDAILANAVRICEANFGTLLLYDGAEFRLVAAHNPPPAFAELRRRQPEVRSSGVLARLVATKQLQHLPDCTEDASYKQGDVDFVQFVKLCGARTFLAAPMLKGSELIGVIGIHRQDVRPFAHKQIELISNFAAQAVIAIENARLLNELRQRTDDLSQRTIDLSEALEQQTATSEVLQVISSSPGDLKPVFQAMLENATRICEAKFGVVFSFDGKEFQVEAHVGTPPSFADYMERTRPIKPLPGSLLDRVRQTKQVSYTADYAAEGISTPPVTLGGARSTVDVPMLKDGELVGAFSIFRQEVRPFTEKQIALLTNFAAQAVIAIENARLLNELRQRTRDLTESLEQQTATSEVLKTISSSPGDLEPVFATMLEKAVRICDAKFGTIYRRHGDAMLFVAAYNAPPAYAQARRRSPRLNVETLLGPMAAAKALVHVADLSTERVYVEQRVPEVVAAVELGGVRTTLVVPMLKENELIGVFSLLRQEVRPFTDKQIELVQNFAAQAVIAIENARLLNELRQRTTDLSEALEQQTATAEVLQVVSSSPGDLEPIFGTMLEKAVRICNASFGNVQRWDGDTLQLVASHNTPPVFAEARQTPYRPDPALWFSRALTTKKVVQITDAASEKVFPERRNPQFVAAVELGA
jgi:GAF domain-containing protein